MRQQNGVEQANDDAIRQNLDDLANETEAPGWKTILNTENRSQTGRPLSLSAIAEAGELLVLRDAYHIYAYHPVANRMLWQINDDSGGPVHLKVLAANAKIVVTAVWFGREERRFWLLGLEPASGQPRWQRRTWWSLGEAAIRAAVFCCLTIMCCCARKTAWSPRFARVSCG